MLPSPFFSLLPFLPLTLCHTSPSHYPSWHPPQQGDVRSPCPMLNSLANHALLPHSGRNITVPLIISVFNSTLNISPELASFTASAGVSLSSDPSLGFFNLDDLDKHNAIEHDASLSRLDLFFADHDEARAAKFNYPTFKRWFSNFRGQAFVDIESAAMARFGQVLFSRKHNPEFTYGEVQRMAGYLETALYFNMMVDKFGRTKKDFVKVFFEEERLPFAEGWKRPEKLFEGFALTDTVLKLALATPEKTISTGEKVEADANNEGFLHGLDPAFRVQKSAN